ncbi:unnamed protein product [Closterium sp. Naga37s-1]|nr:unnamed protein product [Closterium sp. Naga37s-1]
MQAAAAAGSVLKGIAGLTQSPATTVASPGGSKSTVGSAASAIAGAAGPVSGAVATSGIGFGAAIGSAPSSIRGFSSGSNTQQMTEEAAAREEAAASADGAVAGLAVAAKEGAAAEGEEEKPQEIFLANYKPPSYLFDKVSLDFDLHDDYTLVKSAITVVANDKADKPENGSAPLVLDGHDLELVSLQINGVDVPAEEYVKTGKRLTLLSPPASPFTLAIVTRINPAANTSLEGLYRSSGNFCTQCEAEGFRRITYYQDRPDVMSRFTVRMEADHSACPVLLSNGNQIDAGTVGEGEGARHYAVWEDPWPKPCYLFALVAGKLVCCEDTFVTCGGREVALRIWVNAGDEGRTAHAMKSLKESFRWDEEVFGREYDLDLFNVVAVSDGGEWGVQSGAWTFHARSVHDTTPIHLGLGRPSHIASAFPAWPCLCRPPRPSHTADLQLAVGAGLTRDGHGWRLCGHRGGSLPTRVTCRDWFQLTLKEGLTVFRDQVGHGEAWWGVVGRGGVWWGMVGRAVQLAGEWGMEFSSDMNCRAVERIANVAVLRARQFSEDAGPMAHPVRPSSYIKMDNFYTGAPPTSLTHPLLSSLLLLLPTISILCNPPSLHHPFLSYAFLLSPHPAGPVSCLRCSQRHHVLFTSSPRASSTKLLEFPSRPSPHGSTPCAGLLLFDNAPVTVYEKGAEVVKMYQTLLGKDGFRKGMDLYFERHDGQAVTCDDFFAAMADANNDKLEGFKPWLSQAGTPVVTVTSSYSEKDHTFTLHCKQEIPATPGQDSKLPVLIPLAVGLVGPDGKDMPLLHVFDGEKLTDLDGPTTTVLRFNKRGKDTPLLHMFDGEKLTDLDGPTTTVLRFNKVCREERGGVGKGRGGFKETQAEQDFTFTDVPHRPVPSLLRGFSAPVRLNADLSHADWLFLLANDSDEFNRWEACQVLARKMLLRMVDEYRSNKPLHMEDDFTDALAKILDDTSLDKMFIARVISLPGESEIADLMTPYADPDAVHAVRKFCVKQIATRLRPTLEALVESNRAPEGEAYSPEHASMARRSLKNAAFCECPSSAHQVASPVYLASLDDEASGALALSEFRAASNMTDQFAALAALCLNPGVAREEALQAFYSQWKHDGLVMNKWLSLQAASSIPGNVEAVKRLMEHPAFIITEPNKVYSLIGGFTSSAVNLHAADGSGYRFLADMVLQLDKINAQVAARMVSAFTRWRRYDEARQALAKTPQTPHSSLSHTHAAPLPARHQVELERILAAEVLSENVYEIVSKSLSAPPASS